MIILGIYNKKKLFYLGHIHKINKLIFFLFMNRILYQILVYKYVIMKNSLYYAMFCTNIILKPESTQF